jgi:hypothetical protein
MSIVRPDFCPRVDAHAATHVLAMSDAHVKSNADV